MRTSGKGIVTLLLIFISLLITSSLNAQWQPDAGVIYPFTRFQDVKVFPSSFTPAENNNPYHVVDGNDRTFWQSDAPLPYGFTTREDLNIFLYKHNGFGFSGITDLINITDGNRDTKSDIGVEGDLALLRYMFNDPLTLRSISLKCLTSDSISLIVYKPEDQFEVVGHYYMEDNTKWLRFTFSDQDNGDNVIHCDQPGPIIGIALVSRSPFSVFELAGLNDYPTEYTVIDLGKQQEVGQIYSRHFAGGNAFRTNLYWSNDANNWFKIESLDPGSIPVTCVTLDSTINMRFIKLEHVLSEGNWKKCFVWEIAAYNEYGPYGKMQDAKRSYIKLKDQLGVNTVWGWGTNKYSDLLGKNEGPGLYKSLATHARNYHNLIWDTWDPDTIPYYEGMPGSLAQWWLDWDREYAVWKTHGYDIHATIQFNVFEQPIEKWNAPFESSYNFGNVFGRHFGPSNGTGAIKVVEIGNEPWRYPADFYQAVARGMTKGLRDADPNLIILPCALQSYDPNAENREFQNYAGARLTPLIASRVDAYNGHYYSYVTDKTGKQYAVHPEHPASSFRGIINDLRFRDHNMPGKGFYVSEFGWDSDGAGENCGHSECVDEGAQAIYTMRSILMMARLGVDKMTYYYYANEDRESIRYSRSGYTGSASTGFKKKLSYHAVQKLVELLGDTYFLGVLQEDEKAWVYMFGNDMGYPTHIVAWRPVDINDEEYEYVDFLCDFNLESAWRLGKEYPVFQMEDLPVCFQGHIRIAVNNEPLVIRVSR